MRKFYAGVIPQQDKPAISIVTSDWDECEALIKHKTGAFGRKFYKLEDACAFARYVKDITSEWCETIRANKVPTAYVDGSCTAKRKNSGNPGLASWGLAVYSPDDILLHEDNGVVDWEEVPGRHSRQVAGEFVGVIKALEWAKINEQPVILGFDYLGSCYAATGIWESETELSKWYTSKLASIGLSYITAWRWIPGHTGVKGNEHADNLAGKALTQFRN